MSELFSYNKQIFDKYFPQDNTYSFECEIVPPLSGNIIYYGNKNGMLIVIRPIGGRVILDGKEYQTIKLNDQTFQRFLEEMLDKNKVFTFDINQYELKELDSDSIETVLVKKTESWNLEKIDILNNYKDYVNGDLISIAKEKLQEFIKFKDTKFDKDDNYTNDEIYTIQLNKIPKDKRVVFKTYREDMQELMFNSKQEIKNVLLKQINKNVEEKRNNNFDIEGLVYRDIQDDRSKDELIKLVDRDYFSKLNKFFWEPIETLTKYDFKNDKPQIKNIFKQRVEEQILGSENATWGQAIKSLGSNKTEEENTIQLLYYRFYNNEDKTKTQISKIISGQAEQRDLVEQAIRKFKDGYISKDLKIIVKKYGDKEKEIKYSQTLYDRFSESLLNVKKQYLDIIDIFKRSDSNFIKLVIQCLFIFCKEDSDVSQIEKEIGSLSQGEER